MFLGRTTRHRTIRSLQIQSETRRHHTPLGRMLMCDGPQPHTCQWIDGEPRGQATEYCGGITQPGSAYCATHHRRCYMPVGKISADKAAERDLDSLQRWNAERLLGWFNKKSIKALK